MSKWVRDTSFFSQTVTVLAACFLASLGYGDPVSDSAGVELGGDSSFVGRTGEADLDAGPLWTNLMPVHREMMERLSQFDRVPSAFVPSPCFYGPVSEDMLRAFDAFYSAQEVGARFNASDTDRWDTTSVDGAVSLGNPLTLTVSLVRDGRKLLNNGSGDGTLPGFGEPDVASDLLAKMDAKFGSRAAWETLLVSVFDTWGEQTGITYVYLGEETNDPTPSTSTGAWVFPGGSGSGSTSPGDRGDIRIGGHSIDGVVGFIAYNYFPTTGDMVIDTDDSILFFGLAGNNFRLFRNMLSHEHGHGMGLFHVCPNDGTKMMEPIVTTAFDHSALDDIAAGNRRYGDPGEKSGGNDTSGTATSRGVLAGEIDIIGDGSEAGLRRVSIDDAATDQDFYSFTLVSTEDVTVLLTPIGFNALQGDQSSGDTPCAVSPTAPLDGRAVLDLGVQLIDTDGSTVLVSANVGGEGSSETIGPQSLSAGTYFVRVFSNSTPIADDGVQLYELSLAVGGAPLPVGGDAGLLLLYGFIIAGGAAALWRRRVS